MEPETNGPECTKRRQFTAGQETEGSWATSNTGCRWLIDTPTHHVLLFPSPSSLHSLCNKVNNVRSAHSSQALHLNPPFTIATPPTSQAPSWPHNFPSVGLTRRVEQMEEIGDGRMDLLRGDLMDLLRGDLMKKLDDDTAIHVLQYLDTTRDIANASGVCRSWRRFVLEGQLWKGLCLKEFPEVKTFEEVDEIDPTRDAQAAGSSGSSFRQNLEREERIYRHLFRELRHEPITEKSCIREAVVASSTDNYPEESIVQTLYPRPRYSDEQTPSYWSSTGQRDVNCPETLTYNLLSNLCVVHEVRIRPFQAFFQSGHPIYSANYVRIRLGHAIETAGTDCDSAKKEYVWSYESPKFIMEQVDSMQVFKLPRPVLCIGGVLQVELLGRVQTQQMDQLYYICICHVSVVGWPLSDFRVRLSGDRKFFLEYIGQFKVSEIGADGANKFLGPEGETPTGTWMSFAERIRQLRATRVLRPNRLFLNTLLGNITVASLLLAQEDQDSSDDEVEMEDVEGDGDVEDNSSL